VPGVLEFLRETQRDRGVLVEDDAPSVVILNEGGAELPTLAVVSPSACAA